MSTGLGVKGIAGVGKQSVFRTAVNATDKIPFLNESLEILNEDVMHEYLSGGAGILDMQRIFEPIGGSLESVICYDQKNGAAFVGSSILIAAGMGTNSFNSAYNEITFLDDLATILTIAIDKGVNADDVWETIGAMISGFTIQGAAGEVIRGSFDVQASQLAIDSTENTVAELAALPTDLITKVLFSDLIFRIGDQAGAMASTDEIGINSFNLTINNNLSPAEQATPDDTNVLTYDHSSSMEPIQPRRNGFRECTLEIVVPRYTDDTFLDWRTNNTALQGDLKFSEPGAPTGEFNIILPHMKIESIGAPVSGPEIITQTITIRCLKRNSASDMAFTDTGNDVGEVWFETLDERTAAII